MTNNVILKESLFQNYAYHLKVGGIKMDAKQWLTASAAVSIVGAIIVFLTFNLLLSSFLKFPEIILFTIITFLVLLDLTAGFPYIKGLQYIENIERDLPDALRQLSDSLKSGSTYEAGLREIASSDYGPLSEEMQKVLRKLEEGDNFENALSSLSQNVHSRLVQRTITIIIDSVRAGAGLAEILEEISEDARESYRIGVERKTRTLMQTLFIVMAGVLVAPMIFGIISEIVTFLITVSASSGISDPVTIRNALNARDMIVLSIEIYLFIQVVAAGIMIGLMREGRAGKSLIYLPILLLVAYLTFFIAKGAISFLLLGLGGVA